MSTVWVVGSDGAVVGRSNDKGRKEVDFAVEEHSHRNNFLMEDLPKRVSKKPERFKTSQIYGRSQIEKSTSRHESHRHTIAKAQRKELEETAIKAEPKSKPAPMDIEIVTEESSSEVEASSPAGSSTSCNVLDPDYVTHLKHLDVSKYFLFFYSFPYPFPF